MLRFFREAQIPLLSTEGQLSLPTDVKESHQRRPSSSWSRSKRKRTRLLFVGLLSLCAFGVFQGYDSGYDIVDSFLYPELDPELDPDYNPDLSPTYTRYHDRERNLPQHNLSIPAPDGRHAKYIWVRNHVKGDGWGNFMQELVLNSYLAYASRRSFVFDNFTWDIDGPEFEEYKGTPIVFTVPLSAVISGPIVGEAYPPESNVPRSVSKQHFYDVCSQQTVINTFKMNTELAEAGADEMVQRWVEMLDGIEDPCVEIDVNSSQIFEIWVFGSGRRLLPIWPELSMSPILTQFRWSPLVVNAYRRNRDLLGAPGRRRRLPSSFPRLPSRHQFAPIPGLLALHIRRGDFASHCHHFANWSSTFMGFSSFSSLPDRFTPPLVPPGLPMGRTSPENTEIYLSRCIPSIDQIVEKVIEIRKTSVGRHLHTIYIMTNEVSEWLENLKRALNQVADWRGIVSSRDMRLTMEQKYVAPAMDMMIGHKAQVFVGNGFSSMTSNVVMLRMAKGFPPESSRLW